MENDVFVLLLGANAGAYALAATFAGEYGIPVAVMDEQISPAISRSAFVGEARTVPGIGYRGIFMRALSDFYAAHAGHSLLLIPTTEALAAAVLAEREELERMYLLPQKKVEKTEKISFMPTGLLLSYVSREGSTLALYGRVVARSEQGEPLAVCTEQAPSELLARLGDSTPSFTLYTVAEDGRISPMSDGGSLSPFCLFPSAADASLAEWMLTDYVTCEAPVPCEAKAAVFSLCSYGALKPYILAEEREAIKTLKKKKLFLSLVTMRGEKRNPIYRRKLRAFCADILPRK